MSKQRVAMLPSKAQQQAIEGEAHFALEQKLMIDCFSVLFAATWTMILSTSLVQNEDTAAMSALGYSWPCPVVVESVMKKLSSERSADLPSNRYSH